MNAPTIGELRNAGRELADERMEQVRELLVGDVVRTLELRISALEARINEAEIGLARQLDALETRIQELAGSAEDDRRAAFEALAGSISDLGEQIRRISRT